MGFKTPDVSFLISSIKDYAGKGKRVVYSTETIRGSHLHLVLWQVFALAGNVDPFVYIGRHSPSLESE